MENKFVGMDPRAHTIEEAKEKKNRLSIGNAMHYCCLVEFHNSWLISIDTACGLAREKRKKKKKRVSFVESLFSLMIFFLSKLSHFIILSMNLYCRCLLLLLLFLSISWENATDFFFFFYNTHFYTHSNMNPHFFIYFWNL